MFKLVTQILLLFSILVCLCGCPNKKQSITNKKHAKKTKISIQNNPNPVISSAVLAEVATSKEITYNYTPTDFLDEDLFNNLILSDNRSYQLTSPNGSEISEPAAKELENLVLAWDKNCGNLNQALQLWQEEDFAIRANNGVCEVVFFSPEHVEISNSEQINHLQRGFELAKQAVDSGHQVIIKGYADQSNEVQNDLLALERAQNVKNELVKMGIEEQAINIAVADAFEQDIQQLQVLADHTTINVGRAEILIL